MRIRLWGLDSECQEAIQALSAVLVIVSVDGPKHDRDRGRGESKLVRYYVETRGLRLCPAGSSSSSSST